MMVEVKKYETVVSFIRAEEESLLLKVFTKNNIGVLTVDD